MSSTEEEGIVKFFSVTPLISATFPEMRSIVSLISLFTFSTSKSSIFIVPFVVVIAFRDFDIFSLRRRQPERLIIFSRIVERLPTLCFCVAVITEEEEDKEEDNIAPYSFRVFLSWEQTEFCALNSFCVVLSLYLSNVFLVRFLMTFRGQTRVVALFFVFLFFFGGRESSSQLKSLFIKFFEKKTKRQTFFSSDETKRHYLLDELKRINAHNK